MTEPVQDKQRKRHGLLALSLVGLVAAMVGASFAAVPLYRLFCQATGYWGGGLIAERFDGTNWRVEGIPTNGLTNPSLADVSCPSRFFCMAVGNKLDAPFPQRPTVSTLAAKWTP